MNTECGKGKDSLAMLRQTPRWPKHKDKHKWLVPGEEVATSLTTQEQKVKGDGLFRRAKTRHSRVVFMSVPLTTSAAAVCFGTDVTAASSFPDIFQWTWSVHAHLNPHWPFKLGDEQRCAGDAQGHQRQRVDHWFHKGQPSGNAWQNADDHFEPWPALGEESEKEKGRS